MSWHNVSGRNNVRKRPSPWHDKVTINKNVRLGKLGATAVPVKPPIANTAMIRPILLDTASGGDTSVTQAFNKEKYADTLDKESAT